MWDLGVIHSKVYTTGSIEKKKKKQQKKAQDTAFVKVRRKSMPIPFRKDL